MSAPGLHNWLCSRATTCWLEMWRPPGSRNIGLFPNCDQQGFCYHRDIHSVMSPANSHGYLAHGFECRPSTGYLCSCPFQGTQLKARQDLDCWHCAGSGTCHCNVHCTKGNVHTCACADTPTHACTYAQAHRYVYIHMCIMHTYTHVDTQTSLQ